jgi:hypothetical protein
VWAGGALGLAIGPASGQVSLPTNPDNKTMATVESGGKVGYDLLRVSADRPGLALRFGQVRRGSETVTFEGRTLRRDVDYTIDYASGTVYLKLPARSGESVTVEYRYDEATGREGTFGVGTAASKAFPGFTFQMSPGTNLMLGLGLTERLGDGTVLQSDVYGLDTSMSFNGGGLKGVWLVGERRRAQTSNLFGDAKPASAMVEEGKSHAIVQSLGSNFAGGKVQLDYQDVGAGFGGFQAFQGAGFDSGRIAQLQNERGLKRTSFTASGLGGAALNLGAGLKIVGDDQGSVEWRNYMGKVAGIDVAWAAQRVSEGFARFSSLAEADRDQLARERGLERQTFAASKAWQGGGLKFDSLKVEDLNATGLYRRSAQLEAPWVKAGFRDQHVQAGFTRFGDLREGDRDQLAREQGLVRQDMSFSLTPKVVLDSGQPAPEGGQPVPETTMPLRLDFSKGAVRTDTGDLSAIDLAASLGRFAFEHGRREVDAGFARLGSLTGQELTDHAARSLRLIDPDAKVQGHDVNAWLNAAGIARTGWRARYDFGAGTTVRAEGADVRGAMDDIDLLLYQFASPKVSVTYRDLDIGAGFTELGRLMPSELQRLGSVAGLEKTDFSLDFRPGPGRSMSYASMRAGDPNGSAFRQVFALADKGLTLSYARRSVDPTFAGLAGLVDPERDRMLGMVGYDQTEAAAAWQVNPALALQATDSRMENATLGQSRQFSSSAIRWSLDRLTQFMASRTAYRHTDPEKPLVDQTVEAFSLSRDFGRLGKLTVSEEERNYNGANDTLPDSTRQTVVYEGSVTKSTSVRTEHSRTRYDTGEQETTTSHTLAQALSPRIGVSVTDTQVRRDGERPDEQHRDYGFWVDFGRNIRLNYKSKRDLVGDQGTLQNEVSVSPGEFQGVKVGSMSYQRLGWDDQRDVHVGNVNLANAKPLDWGWMKDVRFHYAVDSARDRYLWQREKRSMGFGGRIGGFGFGFDYRSQSLPEGDRAIDRQFTVTTDVTGKSKIRGQFRYNLRTLPFDQQVMVRDYSIVAEPWAGWSLTHQLLTNPLQADQNVMLGDAAQPIRSNRWTIGYTRDPSTHVSFGYEEMLNEQNGLQVYATKVGLTLFADNPSPLYVEYVMGQTNEGNWLRRQHGFNLRFDQRPGPNQTLSFRFGNTNWELARPPDQRPQNWTMRLDYAVRF